MRKPKWQEIGDQIVDRYDGRMFFNLKEVSRITGYGRNIIARKLYEAGILVKTEGRDKRISAYEIGTLMATGRIAAVD